MSISKDAEIERLRALLARCIKYAREDRMVTPGVTRLARALAEGETLLAEISNAGGDEQRDASANPERASVPSGASSAAPAPAEETASMWAEQAKSGSMTEIDLIEPPMHIRRNRFSSWCGAQLSITWAFESLEHALASVAFGSRLVVCERCRHAAEQEKARAPTACEHDHVQPGPDLPRLYGSWASEVCSRCGAWRTMGHANRAHLSEWKTGPMPVDEERP